MIDGRKPATHGFVRKTATLVTGTAVAQAITVMGVPLLARFYAPEAFGVFGAFASVVSIASSVACLRYETAIVLPKDRRTAVNLLAVCLVAAAIAGLVTATALLLWEAAGPRYGLATPTFAGLAGLAVCLVGCYQGLNYWATRDCEFGKLSRARVAQASTSIGSQFAFTAIGTGPLGLVLGQVVGYVVSTVALAFQVFRTDWGRLAKLIRVARMKRAAREYSDFPRYSAPQAVTNAVSQQLPVLVLASSTGEASAGLYVLAMRVVQMPLTLIGQALRQVFLQSVAGTDRAIAARALLIRTTIGAGALALPPAALLVAFGPELFSLVFGPNWEAAGTYARWLTLWVSLGLVAVPATAFAQVARRQRAVFVYDAALLLSRIAALSAGVALGGAYGAVVGYSIVGALFNGGFTVWACTWPSTDHEVRGSGNPASPNLQM